MYLLTISKEGKIGKDNDGIYSIPEFNIIVKEYGEKEEIVLTDEEKEAGIKIYGDGNPYKLDEDDGLYYLYTR